MSDKKELKSTKIEERQLVIFKLAGEEFGVDISEVKEIIKMEEFLTILSYFWDFLVLTLGSTIEIHCSFKRRRASAIDRSHQKTSGWRPKSPPCLCPASGGCQWPQLD